ncbi:hypothetical protein EXIGLDRAFT_846098 [Exidia glandulosa HHB12029]|uniref:Nudix hydrolase domain-containing protein n=1 Tax=Exidia glandulosa HHB12029 TaxID=1314781 RepID=A0A165B5L0_EXIGL|nr:hypothetical protein EXIGLDRAFT_846098 [Exidia glandulosa HHB12029]
MAAMSTEEFTSLPTRNSTDLWGNNHWASADFRIQVGLVVIDSKRDRVLFVREHGTDTDTLPRGADEDVNEMLRSPLRAAEAVCGRKCHRLALPKLEKDYVDGGREAVACVTDESTIDPFYVTFDTLWVDRPGQRWPDAYQRITFWFAGSVDFDASPDSPPAAPSDGSLRWVPLEDVLDVAKGNDLTVMILNVFKQLWDNLKKPPNERVTILK